MGAGVSGGGRGVPRGVAGSFTRPGSTGTAVPPSPPHRVSLTRGRAWASGFFTGGGQKRLQREREDLRGKASHHVCDHPRGQGNHLVQRRGHAGEDITKGRTLTGTVPWRSRCDSPPLCDKGSMKMVSRECLSSRYAY